MLLKGLLHTQQPLLFVSVSRKSKNQCNLKTAYLRYAVSGNAGIAGTGSVPIARVIQPHQPIVCSYFTGLFSCSIPIIAVVTVVLGKDGILGVGASGISGVSIVCCGVKT